MGGLQSAVSGGSGKGSHSGSGYVHMPTHTINNGITTVVQFSEVIPPSKRVQVEVSTFK